MPAKLSVNLNAIAMLRNRRDLPWPSVTGIGRLALAAGAHGLTVHPRPDERHTRHSDVPEIRALIDDEFPQAEFNIEGYPSEDFLALVEKHQPEQVTLGQGRSRRLRSMAMALRLTESLAGMSGVREIRRLGRATSIRSAAARLRPGIYSAFDGNR